MALYDPHGPRAFGKEVLLFFGKLWFVEHAEPLGLGLILFLQILSRDQRCVDRVEGEVGQERTFLVRGNEPAGFARQSIRQVFAWRPVLQSRVAVGHKVFTRAVGPPSFPTALVHVEALVLRPKLFGRAQMPLASEKRSVAVPLERLGQGDLCQVHPIVQRCGGEPFGPLAGEPVRRIGTAGVLARHDTQPRW